MKSLLITLLLFSSSVFSQTQESTERLRLKTEVLSEVSFPEAPNLIVQTYTGKSSLIPYIGQAGLSPQEFDILPPVEIQGNRILRKRENLEPLYEYLLRHIIVKVNKDDTEEVVPDRIFQSELSNRNLEIVRKAFSELVKLNARLPIETSIFNLFVEYTNDHKTEVKRVVVELAPPFFQSLNTQVNAIEDMVNIFASQMTDALKLSTYPLDEVSFEEGQSDPKNVLRRNMLGEYTRVIGITEEYEKFLLEQIEDELKGLGYKLDYGYYFGSRVLPRSLAYVRLEKYIEEFGLRLPTQTGTIVHNSVREGGITKLSDIEIFLIVRPLQDNVDTSKETEEQIRIAVRDRLNATTRRLHFGLKVAVADTSLASPLAGYLFLGTRQIGRSWLPMPNQYVSFYEKPVSEAELCAHHFTDPRAEIYQVFKNLAPN